MSKNHDIAKSISIQYGLWLYGYKYTMVYVEILWISHKINALSLLPLKHKISLNKEISLFFVTLNIYLKCYADPIICNENYALKTM